MNERREPTISAYSPSKEDVARQQAAKAKGGRPTSPPPQARSSAQSPAARPIVAKSRVAPFAFLLALLASAGAGLAYWQLLETQKQLSDASSRIAELESKFAMSDDESTASVQTLQAKLKWTDSEIRKLWGVSYDTNRKAIATNKEDIIKAARAGNEAKKTAQGLAGELRVVSELVDAQQSSMAAIEQQNQTVSSEYQSLVDKLNILDTNSKQLESRIKTNEQAIEAIDAFRRNVNQQLLQLRGG